jgi:hypothetical protein
MACPSIGWCAGGNAGAIAIVRLDADAKTIAAMPETALPWRWTRSTRRHSQSRLQRNAKGGGGAHASLAKSLRALSRISAAALLLGAVHFCGFDASHEQVPLPLIGGGAVAVISDAARNLRPILAPSSAWGELVSCVRLFAIRPGRCPQFPEHLALGGEFFTATRRRLHAGWALPMSHLYGLTGTIVRWALRSAGRAARPDRASAELPGLCIDDGLQPVPAGVAGSTSRAGLAPGIWACG